MTTTKPETETKPVEKLPFKFESVKKKPSRKYRKGSKYDPILNGFLNSEHSLVKVEIADLDANYMRTQLNKRIEVEPKFSKISVSVINAVCYLEKK